MNQQLLDYLADHFIVTETLYDASWFKLNDDVTEDDFENKLHDINDSLMINESHDDMLFRMGERDIAVWDDIMTECVDGLVGFDVLAKGIAIKDINILEEITISSKLDLRISTSAHYFDNGWFFDTIKHYDIWAIVENSAAHWKVFIEEKKIPMFQKELALQLLKR